MKPPCIRIEGLESGIDMLRPGWRGRLRVRTPELAARDRSAEIVGTIVSEPLTASEVDDEGTGDAFVTFCPNYRNGRFGPTLGEPHIEIDLSWIVAAEAM